LFDSALGTLGPEEVSGVLDRFSWFRQAGYRWAGDGLTLYIDPWMLPEGQPPADVIFITHAHDDHFSPQDIDSIRKAGTTIVAPADVASDLSGEVTAVAPGGSGEVRGVRYQAVPAYNVLEDRQGYHPQANGWVGYILSLGDQDVYHAGDTDHLPELESISAATAFVPVGGTYTMDPGQAADLVKAMRPGLAVPMHYGFLCGSSEDAERFRDLAAPVSVEILRPADEFEHHKPATPDGSQP
jgi:L-ascorbate metabolism protein UlaG (beta-lactamase superfamily)